MRLIAAIAVLAVALAGLWLWYSGHYASFTLWALEQQRTLQNELAQLIMAARQGEAGVVWALVGASALYGFAHAAGPGHGKFLIGGAGLASRARAWTMAWIAMAAAVAQGLTAVVLVYGGLGVLSVGTGWAVETTDNVLTPLSYGVIVAIGLVLVWRGARSLLKDRLGARHVHAHGADGTCGCGHRHGPTTDEIARLGGWRDTLALIGGIAIRPCTGAVMVLVIAWQTGLHVLGFSAVMAMAIGTGGFTALVALASVSVREATFTVSSPAGLRLAAVAPALQLAAGGVVIFLGAGLLAASLA